MRKAYFISNKSSYERTLGRTRHRWENNININFKELLCGYVDWVYFGPE
jgi:hypothetical protein